MADRSPAPLARSIRAAVLDLAAPATPDADLLRAFVRHRDPAAFEAVVRRHGPLVAAACRAVLADPADADDATQATFVVLYRKAHTVRDAGTLAGWLFRVARRAALEVKKAAARRRAHEARAGRRELVPATDLTLREACAVLHQEIDALPPRYRLPLIACYLEGKTQAEAARGLGWSAEVVRGRLDRGREKLRQRLRHRSITLSAALLAGAAVPPAAPAIGLTALISPSSTVATAARAATAAGRAWTVVGGLAMAAGLLIGVTVLVAGAGQQTTPAPATPAKEPAVAKPVAKVDAFGDLLPDGAVARLGTVRFNHGEGLRALAHSPDGKTVVSVGNGTARVWDAETGVERLQFSTGTTDWDEQVVVTPDRKRLVLVVQSFGKDPIRVFELATGKQHLAHAVTVKRNEMSVERRNAVSPDGKLAALFTQDRVHVFDVETAKELYALPKNGRDVKSIAFAGPDRLVTSDASRKIEVWDATTGKLDHSFDHGDPVWTIAASADGKLLATVEHTTAHVERALEKDVVRVWDLATGKRIHELAARPGRWFMRIGFSPDGKAVHGYSVQRYANETTVWDCSTGKQIAEIPGTGGQVTALGPEGQRLAAGADMGKFDVWDTATGKPVAPAVATRPWVGAVHLSADGSRAMTLGSESITTWDAATGRPVGKTDVSPHLFERPWCRFSPDGRYALTVEDSAKDGKVVIWDVAAARPVQTIPVPGEPYGLTATFSHDSAKVALRFPAKEPTVSVRDVKTGKEEANFRLPKNDWHGQLFFTADGQTLFITGKRTAAYALPEGTERYGWTVEVQPTKDRDMIVGPGGEAEQPAFRSLVVSPDGALAAYVLSAGFGVNAKIKDRLAVCDGRTGQFIRRWSDSGRQTRGYEMLMFSPDGRLLASSDGFDIRLWEVATGKEVRTFRGHRNEVENMAFSGNGRRLASSSWDGTVLIWDLSPAGKAEPDRAGWWADLLSDDGAKAYAAVWRLADAPVADVIPFLRKSLRPVPVGDVEKVQKAIANLDSDEFRVRDRAFKELTDFGYNAGPALRAALAKKPTAEKQARLEQLVGRIAGPPASGESLRTIRALAVLEYKGTPEAKKVLRELAAGAEGMWLTQEARAGLRRVEGR